MDQTYKKRHRVNFKQSAKGIIQADVTFEATDMERTEVIKEAARLLDEALIVAKERSFQ